MSNARRGNVPFRMDGDGRGRVVGGVIRRRFAVVVVSAAARGSSSPHPRASETARAALRSNPRAMSHLGLSGAADAAAHAAAAHAPGGERARSPMRRLRRRRPAAHCAINPAANARWHPACANPRDRAGEDSDASIGAATEMTPDATPTTTRPTAPPRAAKPNAAETPQPAEAHAEAMRSAPRRPARSHIHEPSAAPSAAKR